MSTKVTTDFLVTLVTKVASVLVVTFATVFTKVTKVASVLVVTYATVFTKVTKVSSGLVVTFATVLTKVTTVRWSLRTHDSITNVSLLRKFPVPFQRLRGGHKRYSQHCCFNIPDLDRNTAQ